MFDDPAVRSVRVALALCDRFQELLKGPTTVTAAKQRGALVGVSGDQEGLSMRIGEAQQIYPEIWQHLDEARKVFAGRGIDVSAFDRIRETEGEALGANVGLDHRSYGYGSHGVDQQVKTAGFNTQGLGRARQACKVLMEATPEIDWRAIAAAESADPAAADFTRAQRNKRFMRLAALALLIAAPFLIVMYMRHEKRAKMDAYREDHEPQKPYVEPMSDADRAAVAKLAAELRPQLTKASASWSTVVSKESLDALKLGTAPCSYETKAPPQAAIDEFVRNGDAGPSFTASDFFGYRADRPIPGDVIASALRMVDAVEKRIATNTATRYDLEPLNAIPKFIRLIKILEETPADFTAKTFTPGRVRAAAYVYSVRDAKMICAAMLDVANMPPESSPYREGALGPRGDELLHREMEVRLRQGLAADLHAVE